MTSGKLQISELEEQDIEDLFVFREKMFPKNDKQLDQERWGWLFMRNPAADNTKTQTWVLRDGEDIVGTISNIPLRLKVSEREVVASFGCDYYVDENYLGLPALRLIKAMQKQHNVNVGANLSASAKKLFSKMRYSDLSANLHVASTFFPVNSAEASIKSLLKFYFNKGLREILNNKKYSSRTLKTLPESVDKLWEKASPKLSVSIVKDYGYLAWRYEQCPSVDYYFVVLEDEHELSALAVLSILEDDKDKKRGLISDILIEPGNSSAFRGIIKSILDFFQATGCSSCFTHFMCDRVQAYFKLMGFNISKSDLGLMVLLPHVETQALQDLIDPIKWSFWMGDTDRY